LAFGKGLGAAVAWGTYDMGARDHPWGGRMPHAKFGRHLLKNVAMQKKRDIQIWFHIRYIHSRILQLQIFLAILEIAAISVIFSKKCFAFLC